MYKLIRNKYEDIIDKDDLTIVDPLDSPEVYRGFVMDKLNEELNELAETDYTDIDEYADVYEVFLTLMKIHGITEAEVREARINKVKDKGSFSKGLILKY